MTTTPGAYPRWKYYPQHAHAPEWVDALLGVFATCRPQIDSTLKLGLTSDRALALLMLPSVAVSS